jgi:uncharacterized protein DUF1552
VSAAAREFRPSHLNRRNFLRGAAGVTLALPFLEGMPERSAWAADAKPVFSLFICAVAGVVPEQFFPTAPGPITPESLAGKATAQLAAHAKNLLFVSGIRRPAPTGDSHVEGLCEALTGGPDLEPGKQVATAMGPSADTFIAAKVHPALPPLVLYSGNRKNGWSTWNLSFTDSGKLAPAIWNPYTLYQELIGLATPGGGTTPAGEKAAKLLLESRKSIHDLVREDLSALIKSPRLSSADRERLQLHFDSVRDVEIAMGGMGNTAVERCSNEGLAIDQLQAMEDFVYDRFESTEKVGKLHMSLVALAFACNYRRSASLQWGDPTDHTIYRVPSNEREWNLTYIQHRAQSDSAVGSDPLAAQAHAEIDALRMQSFAAGLDHFDARGLRDQCAVLWTNSYSDGRLHSFANVPHIIWGNAGGYLKQGQHVDAGDVGNNRLLNTLISAAIQDTGTTVEDFGQGPGGQLDVMRA